MRDDFDLITYNFPNTQDIRIIPISDVHLGSAECNREAFEKFVEDVLEEENTYIILNGDLIDNATKSSKSDSYLATIPPFKAKEIMADILQPLAKAGKILAITEGNHEQRTARESGEYLGYDIACRLGIEDCYRPNACFVNICFGDEKGNRQAGYKRPSYNLCVTHGSGVTLKRFQDFGAIIDNLDVSIIGHTHNPVITKNKKIYIDNRNKKISTKDYFTVVAGSWLHYGGYAIQKLYKPGSNCLEVITLKANTKKVFVTMI